MRYCDALLRCVIAAPYCSDTTAALLWTVAPSQRSRSCDSNVAIAMRGVIAQRNGAALLRLRYCDASLRSIAAIALLRRVIAPPQQRGSPGRRRPRSAAAVAVTLLHCFIALLVALLYCAALLRRVIAPPQQRGSPGRRRPRSAAAVAALLRCLLRCFIAPRYCAWTAAASKRSSSAAGSVAPPCRAKRGERDTRDGLFHDDKRYYSFTTTASARTAASPPPVERGERGGNERRRGGNERERERKNNERGSN